MNYWQRLVRTVAPDDPVVELEEIKKHCRVEYFTDDDDYLTELVEVATAFIEGPYGIGICLMPQTWRLSLDYFPSEIVIPLGPVTAISGITYTDADGDSATVSTWRADLDSSPCRIWPARDTAWPVSTLQPGAVKVTFTAGYETVPSDLKAAIKLIVGNLYENREAATEIKLTDLPFGVSAILERYRAGRVA